MTITSIKGILSKMVRSGKNLTKEQLETLPQEQDIQLYEELGYYISPIVLPDALLDRAVSGAEALYRGERDRGCPEIIGPANDVYDETKVLMNNEYACLQRSEIWNVVSEPIIAAIAARLARTDEIRLFADALICKFPAQQHNNGAFGWHTDKAYWPSCTSNDMLKAWIPFQDTTLNMGPMHVIERSHHWPMDAELRKFCAAGNQNLMELESYLANSGKKYRNVPMTLKKGQLSFHNGNVFHGSPANLSDRRRMTLTIHMQDRKNTYKAAYKENGDKILIGYERMCGRDINGNPDYRDPKFFPVLWSE